ncbi:hypothetical protein MACJ_002883 [Theileria orientalis]|uniref:Uncharacterized protein n=1 Tax=Theileria orientalis TaxID=68886 RepID=A0A976M6Y4_THEOR|nr:hypothetical protein MACJ_002883 [Theileria orientalis]
MNIYDHETDSVDNYHDDSDNNDESDPDNDSELSYYELLMKGNELYLGEEVGLESFKPNCITSNLSGSFLVSGSRDGTLYCINFDKWSKGGFGEYWKVKLEQSVNEIAFNTEESVLAVASGNYLHFYTDGGDLIVSTTRGDMYLLDAKKTKGHTATVTCVANDPKNVNLYASGSMDGTVRLFDIQSTKQNVSLSLNNLNIYTLSNKYLNRNKSANGGQAHAGKNRVAITRLCYALYNYKDVLVAGNEIGKLIVWDYKTTFQNLMIDAHETGIDAVLSYDTNKVVTKSENELKFWDLKQHQKPFKELALPAYTSGFNRNQNVVLSPDNLHLVINTPRGSPEDKHPKSEVWVYDLEKFEVVNKWEVQSQLGPLVWSYETNQLFSYCANGKLYARCTQENLGVNHYTKAQQALEKKNKYAKVSTISAKLEAYPIDYLPDDLIEVEEGVLKKRRVEPQDKYGIPKQEGYDYFKHGKTPITYEDDDIVTKLRSQVEKDTNKELGEEEGIRQIPYRADKFMAIYKKTQPNLILDFERPKTKEEKLLLGVSKCPRCGIKICQCGYMEKNRQR